MLAHEGPSAYEQAFDLLHRFEAEQPNELWQADHTPLDILVLDSSGRSVKPWLTVILDEDLLKSDTVNFHPLHNAASTTVTSADLVKFVKSLGYEPIIANCGQ